MGHIEMMRQGGRRHLREALRRTAAWPLVAVALVGLGVGCSDDSSGGGGRSGGSESPTTTAVSAETSKLAEAAVRSVQVVGQVNVLLPAGAPLDAARAAAIRGPLTDVLVEMQHLSEELIALPGDVPEAAGLARSIDGYRQALSVVAAEGGPSLSAGEIQTQLTAAESAWRQAIGTVEQRTGAAIYAGASTPVAPPPPDGLGSTSTIAPPPAGLTPQ